jgi:hypothetical protein
MSFQAAALEIWARAFWESEAYEKKGALEKYVAGYVHQSSVETAICPRPKPDA